MGNYFIKSLLLNKKPIIMKQSAAVMALFLGTASTIRQAPRNINLFATGASGDEDLGQNIIMKGDKFHYNQEEKESSLVAFEGDANTRFVDYRPPAQQGYPIVGSIGNPGYNGWVHHISADNMPLFASHPQDMAWHNEQNKMKDEEAEREKNKENKLIKEEEARDKADKDAKE